MSKKKLSIKSLKIPLLPFHIVRSSEIRDTVNALQSKSLADKVSAGILAENQEYKNRYGPLRGPFVKKAEKKMMEEED